MFVYLQTVDGEGKPADAYNRRGEVGENDDPASFARMMARHGLAVILSDEDLGKSINGRIVAAMGLVPLTEEAE